MTGHDLNAGAVAGVPNIGNPISVARAVMEKSEHVMLAGNGASAFAEHMGLEIVDPSWFYTKAKFELYQRAKENEKHGTIGCVAHDISALIEYKGYDVERAAREVVEKKLFEVDGNGGVVCLDHHGRAAMITNTSGMFRAHGNSEGDRVVAIFKE